MKYAAATFCSLVLLAGCGQSSDQKTQTSPAPEAVASSSEASADPCATETGDGMIISNAWARAAGEGRTTSAIYLTICNAGAEPDTFIGATSDVADTVELHETTKNAEGVMTMAPIDGLALQSKKSTVLAPGGAHIMLIGLKAPIVAGDKISVTLEFANRPPMPITVEARGMGESGH